MNQKLNLYSGFFIGQYDFTQYVLFMMFIKFENGDKNKFKNRTSLVSITSMGGKNEWKKINWTIIAPISSHRAWSMPNFTITFIKK